MRHFNKMMPHLIATYLGLWCSNVHAGLTAPLNQNSITKSHQILANIAPTNNPSSNLPENYQNAQKRIQEDVQQNLQKSDQQTKQIAKEIKEKTARERALYGADQPNMGGSAGGPNKMLGEPNHRLPNARPNGSANPWGQQSNPWQNQPSNPWAPQTNAAPSNNNAPNNMTPGGAPPNSGWNTPPKFQNPNIYMPGGGMNPPPAGSNNPSNTPSTNP